MTITTSRACSRGKKISYSHWHVRPRHMPNLYRNRTVSRIPGPGYLTLFYPLPSRSLARDNVVRPSEPHVSGGVDGAYPGVTPEPFDLRAPSTIFHRRVRRRRPEAREIRLLDLAGARARARSEIT